MEVRDLLGLGFVIKTFAGLSGKIVIQREVDPEEVFHRILILLLSETTGMNTALASEIGTISMMEWRTKCFEKLFERRSRRPLLFLRWHFSILNTMENALPDFLVLGVLGIKFEIKKVQVALVIEVIMTRITMLIEKRL